MILGNVKSGAIDDRNIGIFKISDLADQSFKTAASLRVIYLIYKPKKIGGVIMNYRVLGNEDWSDPKQRRMVEKISDD